MNAEGGVSDDTRLINYFLEREVPSKEISLRKRKSFQGGGEDNEISIEKRH